MTSSFLQTPTILTSLAVIFGVMIQSSAVPATEQNLVLRDSIYNQFVKVYAANGSTPVADVIDSQIALNTIGLGYDGNDGEVAQLLQGLAKNGSPPYPYKQTITDSTGLYYVTIYFDFENDDRSTEAAFKNFQSSIMASTGSEVAGDVARYIIQQMDAGPSAVACFLPYDNAGWWGKGTVAMTTDENSSFDFAGAC